MMYALDGPSSSIWALEIRFASSLVPPDPAVPQAEQMRRKETSCTTRRTDMVCLSSWDTRSLEFLNGPQLLRVS